MRLVRENCTHADHVEGVHPDVGDDLDDLILRHELHLRVSKQISHLLDGCVQGATRGTEEKLGSGEVGYLGGREDGEVRVGLPRHGRRSPRQCRPPAELGGDLVEGATHKRGTPRRAEQGFQLPATLWSSSPPPDPGLSLPVAGCCFGDAENGLEVKPLVCWGRFHIDQGHPQSAQLSAQVRSKRWLCRRQPPVSTTMMANSVISGRTKWAG
jgi:hypothetical protein